MKVHKKIASLFILILCVLASHAQTEERAPYGPKSVRNKRDELGRRQEVWKTYSFDGDLMSEIEYKNDKREGKCIIYYQGGGPKGEKVREESQYLDGKKDGPYTVKYFSGGTAVEGAYDFKLRVGIWTYYFEDGQTKSTGNYVLGKKEGEWKTYNRKGNLTQTINYSAVAPPPVAAPEKKVTYKKQNQRPLLKK